MNIDGYEIERKFLIEMPESSLLEEFEKSEITQVYLLGEKGTTERVRKRSWQDRTVYTHTVKRRISSIRREENEREISAEEYEQLLGRADPGHHIVKKKRYCFTFMGEIWEIDIYPFWADKAIMEIELRDEEQKVELPQQIRIIREVTNDGRYTNAAIARKIPDT